jgi:hypothetical protein
MSKLKCKGTTLEVEIATVMTAIAQVIELDVGQDAIETFDADTLDNASPHIPKEQTGRSSVADISGMLFYDPDAATHQFITDTINAPVKVNGNITLANADELTFEIVSFAMGLTVRMNDGLKAPFTMQRNTPVWPS